MKIRVLGCHGGASPDHRTPCFMLGDHLAVDAGSLCAGLSLDEQCLVDDVVVTHSHLDHVADVAKMADNVMGRRKDPFNLHCSTATGEALKKHLFNNVIWPDFEKLPNPANPPAFVMKIRTHPPARKFNAGELEVMLVPMKHTVDSSAIIIKDPNGGTVVFSGDTGPGGTVWDHINKLKDVRALFVECSLPNGLQKQADQSGHLTPATLSMELKKLTISGFPIIAYHLKPLTFSETRKELRALKMRELHLCRVGDVYEV